MAYSDFKQSLKVNLHKRLEQTVKQRVGPSFDERVDKAVKEMSHKAKACEAEQRKVLRDSVEKGRARPTCAPVRMADEAPKKAGGGASGKKEPDEATRGGVCGTA
mmetsp:Transcript_130056/g.277791  ORF Transcript_130056/g.277791 Transcript_130056/m.277791 type:complete len:105 (+) Transcript_130056:107-421(+)